MTSTAVEGGSVPGRVERWVNTGATVIAPVTALSALLFYFGYVSSRSEYAYFGLDVDTIGLGTQDYIMRSPQPLLTPLLVLALIGAGVLALHAAIRRRVQAALSTGNVDNVRSIRRFARGCVAGGLVLLAAGIMLLAIYGYLRGWAPYEMVTPLVIAVGAGLTAYAWRVLELLGRHREQSTMPRRTSNVLLYVLVAATVFWMTATLAQWSGRALAHYQAQTLLQLPSVILDTKERLFLRDPGMAETMLPASEGQTFHYRYRHLRLLIEGHDRMFLVPDHWSASDSTLVVALDGSVRVQFQFENEAP
jgi:hypothetical protein